MKTNTSLSGSRSNLRVATLMSLIFLASVIFLVVYVVNLQNSIVSSAALDSAKSYSDALKEFRTIYTSEVVARVNKHPDFKVSHDYLEHKFNIPLPATLSMALGSRISEQHTGTEVHLYSPYPFPWRVNTGLNDDFRRKAWQAVTEQKKTTYYEFTEYKGRAVLRFATADIMQQNCVNCHNNHLNTPRTGWKTGDVRGVLEIIHPINISESKTFDGVQGIIILASVIAGLGFMGLLFMVYRFNATTRYLEDCVQKRTQEIKKIEKSLAYSKKMSSIGEVSAGIAHEISQPIGAIKLSCETLNYAVEMGAKDNILRQTDRITKQVDRIDEIVKQLNINNRLGQFRLENLDSIVEKSLEGLQEQFEHAGVTISTNIQKPLPKVNCDREEIERVLTNLLMNSLHAVKNRQEKNIEVKISHSDEQFYIKIIDSGYGISENIVEKIFDPFFTTKVVGEGTGLGLSLSYSIIRNYGGELTVTSELGKGSQFTIALPICSESMEENISPDGLDEIDLS